MHNQTPLALGRAPASLNSNPQNINDILNNFRTPQNLKKMEMRNNGLLEKIAACVFGSGEPSENGVNIFFFYDDTNSGLWMSPALGHTNA